MMGILSVGNTDIPYEVRFSSKASRKRIVVTPGNVEVIAPTGTPWEGEAGVAAYVDRKRRWVFDSVREIEAKHQKLLKQHYASGAKLQYRGRWLMLDVQPGPEEKIEIACRSKFAVTVPEGLEDYDRLQAVKEAFDAWLWDRAERDLKRFGRRHRERLGVEPNAFRLSSAKSRWGSCGRDGVIRVHWRLIQAPKVAMEYVVAHELAHLKVRNHSPEFWKVLAETMPEWEEAKALLERWEEGHRAV